MLNTTPVLSAPGISVTIFECDGRHTGWSSDEPVSEFAVVLVRSGVFRRRVDGIETLAEPMAGYVERPGSIHQVAHPAGGDVCTAIALSAEAADSIIDPSRLANGSRIHIGAGEDLAHRLLLKRVREAAEQSELVERTVTLAGRALGRIAPANFGLASDRCKRMADQVREALNEEPNLDLHDLADLVGRSVYHVSRAFKSATGLTISQYRLSVRARLAMDLLEGGESNLARIALECGFGDQPHMTRTLRSQTSHTPRRLMELITEQN